MSHSLLQSCNRIIVLSPHTDDGELGCGGSIARFVSEGREVYYVVFSNYYDVTDPQHNPKQPVVEMREAMKVFGVHEDRIREHPFPVRRFHEHRQEILQVLWDMYRDLAPDMVLMPNVRDLHQDHSVIAMEGLRAFKKTTILCYEQPWNTVSLDTEAFIVLSEDNVSAKIRALECYESQKERSYLDGDMIRGWARTRGVQVGVNFAETFEVPRLII